jgi:hypothetical protein
VVVVGTTDANEEQDDENVNNYPTSMHSERPYRYLNSHRQTEPPGIDILYELLSNRGATRSKSSFVQFGYYTPPIKNDAQVSPTATFAFYPGGLRNGRVREFSLRIQVV